MVGQDATSSGVQCAEALRAQAQCADALLADLPRASRRAGLTAAHEVPAGTLRIVLLNERCHANPMAGGAEIHLFEIFSRLAARGVSVELLCSGFAGAAARDVHRGVAITRLGARFWFYAKVAREVRRRVVAGEVDLIIEAHNKVPFLTPLYARSVPVLVIHHHLHGLTAFRQVSPWIAAASVALERTIPWVYRRVPFLTISKSSKSDLIRRGVPEESIDVVPCGLDHEVHRAAPTAGRAPLVISLGRLEPYKRIDLLLRSWPAVLAQVPEARLAIVGRGQEEQALRALADRLDIAASVTFTGFVSEAEKVALLQRAALMVQCSTREGWCLGVVEGNSAGTPVVATDVPGLTDSVQDGVTGVLVRKAAPAPLAAAIAKLLLDDETRVRMAQRALSWSANFDWEESASAVLRAARRATSPLPANAAPQHSLVRSAPVSAHAHLVRPALPVDAGVV